MRRRGTDSDLSEIRRRLEEVERRLAVQAPPAEPAQAAARLKDLPPDMKCSFCSKRQHEVAKLIAGPGVYICGECVDLCHQIIVEEAGSPTP